MLVVKSELGEVLVCTDDFILDEGVVFGEAAMGLVAPSLKYELSEPVTAELDKIGAECGTAVRKLNEP